MFSVCVCFFFTILLHVYFGCCRRCQRHWRSSSHCWQFILHAWGSLPVSLAYFFFIVDCNFVFVVGHNVHLSSNRRHSTILHAKEKYISVQKFQHFLIIFFAFCVQRWSQKLIFIWFYAHKCASTEFISLIYYRDKIHFIVLINYYLLLWCEQIYSKWIEKAICFLADTRTHATIGSNCSVHDEN